MSHDQAIPFLRNDRRFEDQRREARFTTRVQNTPIPTYRPLLDGHLEHLWRRPRVRAHLKAQGFWDETGNLVDPEDSRVKLKIAERDLKEAARSQYDNRVGKELRKHDNATQRQRQAVTNLRMQRIDMQRTAEMTRNRTQKELASSTLARSHSSGSYLQRLPSASTSRASSKRGTRSGASTALDISTVSLPADLGKLALESGSDGEGPEGKPSEDPFSMEKTLRRPSTGPSVIRRQTNMGASRPSRRTSTLQAPTCGMQDVKVPDETVVRRRLSSAELLRRRTAPGYLEPSSPVAKPMVTRRPLQGMDLWSLAHDLGIPMDMFRQAVALFKEHAEIPPMDAKTMQERGDVSPNSRDMLRDGLLSREKFRELLGDYSDGSHHDSRPVDFPEFAIKLWSRGFSEDLVLSPEIRELRAVARKHEVSYADIEHYKHEFERFDTDKSGLIEFEEFVGLLTKLSKVPTGMELPQSRVKALWTVADLDGSGELDFEEFLVFFRKYFDTTEVGVCPFEEFYAKAGRAQILPTNYEDSAEDF